MAQLMLLVLIFVGDGVRGTLIFVAVATVIEDTKSTILRANPTFRVVGGDCK